MKSKLFAALLAVLLIGTAAQADLTFSLDKEFSKGQAPAGSGPWATATFEDIGTNQVKLTLTTLMSGTEFVGAGGWSFNLDPILNPDKLQFTFVSGEVAQSIGTGANSFRADGDGNFDFRFFWGTSGSSNRFGPSDTAVYTLTYDGGTINENSFNFSSVPGGDNGTYHSAAHVQNTTGVGTTSGSGWIGDSGRVVPAPGAWVLVLIGLGVISRFRSRLA